MCHGVAGVSARCVTVWMWPRKRPATAGRSESLSFREGNGTSSTSAPSGDSERKQRAPGSCQTHRCERRACVVGVGQEGRGGRAASGGSMGRAGRVRRNAADEAVRRRLPGTSRRREKTHLGRNHRADPRLGAWSDTYLQPVNMCKRLATKRRRKHTMRRCSTSGKLSRAQNAFW